MSQHHHSTPQNSLSYLKENFDTVRFSYTSLPIITDLINEVRNGLPDSQKHFLKPADLDKHLDRGFPIIGTVENLTGEIASVLLITPGAHAHNSQKFDGYPEGLKQEGWGIIHSVAVAPKFRGNQLMEKTLAGAESIAPEEGYNFLGAKVACHNFGSLKGFARSQFEASVRGRDPKLGYDVVYPVKALRPLAITPLTIFNGAHVIEHSSATDFERTQPLSPL